MYSLFLYRRSSTQTAIQTDN